VADVVSSERVYSHTVDASPNVTKLAKLDAAATVIAGTGRARPPL
jgi:hypothetical protein